MTAETGFTLSVSCNIKHMNERIMCSRCCAPCLKPIIPFIHLNNTMYLHFTEKYIEAQRGDLHQFCCSKLQSWDIFLGIIDFHCLVFPVKIWKNNCKVFRRIGNALNGRFRSQELWKLGCVEAAFAPRAFCWTRQSWVWDLMTMWEIMCEVKV